MIVSKKGLTILYDNYINLDEDVYPPYLSNPIYLILQSKVEILNIPDQFIVDSYSPRFQYLPDPYFLPFEFFAVIAVAILILRKRKKKSKKTKKNYITIT